MQQLQEEYSLKCKQLEEQQLNMQVSGIEMALCIYVHYIKYDFCLLL